MNPDGYLRLDRPARIAYGVPWCGACYVDLVRESSGWKCPQCGTTWGFGAKNHSAGVLCPDADGPEVTTVEALLVSHSRYLLAREKEFERTGEWPGWEGN